MGSNGIKLWNGDDASAWVRRAGRRRNERRRATDDEAPSIGTATSRLECRSPHFNDDMGMPEPQLRRAATSDRFSRRAKVLISIATAFAVIVTGTGVATLIVRYQVNANINHVEVAFPVLPDVPTPTAEPQGEPPIDFLVWGSDSRTSGGDPSGWITGGQNSDVMMLLQISGDRQSVNVMSIPRDSCVPIEGHGERNDHVASVAHLDQGNLVRGV